MTDETDLLNQRRLDLEKRLQSSIRTAAVSLQNARMACAPDSSTPFHGLPRTALSLLRLSDGPALWAFEQEQRAAFACTLHERPPAFYTKQGFTQTLVQRLQAQSQGRAYHYLLRVGLQLVGMMDLLQVRHTPWPHALLDCGIPPGEEHAPWHTPAVQLLLDHAFSTHGLHYVLASVDGSHCVAAQALLHNGFAPVLPAAFPLPMAGPAAVPAGTLHFELYAPQPQRTRALAHTRPHTA